jgi:hypothetical protein
MVGQVLRTIEVVVGHEAMIHAMLLHHRAEFYKLLTHQVHILLSADIRPVHSAYQYTII